MNFDFRKENREKKSIFFRCNFSKNFSWNCTNFSVIFEDWLTFRNITHFYPILLLSARSPAVIFILFKNSVKRTSRLPIFLVKLKQKKCKQKQNVFAGQLILQHGRPRGCWRPAKYRTKSGNQRCKQRHILDQKAMSVGCNR